MNRRGFIGRLVAAALGLVATPAAAGPGRIFKDFHRFDYAAGRWVPVAFEAVKAGDVVWIGNKGCKPDEVVLAATDWQPDAPGGDPDGCFRSSDSIDPATNQWTNRCRGGSPA